MTIQNEKHIKFKYGNNEEILEGIIRSGPLKLRPVSETEGYETIGYIVESPDFFTEIYPHTFNIVEDYLIL